MEADTGSEKSTKRVFLLGFEKYEKGLTFAARRASNEKRGGTAKKKDFFFLADWPNGLTFAARFDRKLVCSASAEAHGFSKRGEAHVL